jgi:hypothetical protein
MNTKSFPAAFAAMILLAASGPTAVLAQQNVGVTVVVNGNTMQFDQPPVEQAGRVFVPLRGVFEQLGASVVYQNGQINATGDGRNVSLQIGSTNATVNGQPQTLDQAPFVQGSRTLVPLRFVAQALGANVDWNNNTSTVTISGGGYHGGGGGGYNRPQQPPMNPPSLLVNRRPMGDVAPDSGISADFAQPVRRDSVRITLDGNDVTSVAAINRDGFEYNPRRPFMPGPHRISISGVTMNGTPFSSGWDFRV